jgi:hypothetical protein
MEHLHRKGPTTEIHKAQKSTWRLLLFPKEKLPRSVSFEAI